VDLHDTQQSFAADVEGTAVPPTAVVGTTAVPSQEDFIGSITSKVSALLPVPNYNGQRVRGSAPSSTPRWSMHSWRRSQISSFRLDNKSIDQQAEEYARIFLEPLSDQHVQALTTLFGWTFLMNADRIEGNLLPS
jgi:hypothetical protein